MNKTTWELYSDPSYYDLWAVRDASDTSFNSPRLFYFVFEHDAKAFLALVNKAFVAERGSL